MRVDADDRLGLGVQASLVESLEDEALHPVFVDGAIGSEMRGTSENASSAMRCRWTFGAAMSLELLRSPDRGEALREIGGRAELAAEGGQELGGAGVEARDAGDLVARAVLGGEPSAVAHQELQLLAMLLPGGVERLGAGKMIEHGGLERRDELSRLALARHDVVAAPGHQTLVGEAEQVETDRIVRLEDGEEPAVELGLDEGGLNVGNSVGEHRHLGSDLTRIRGPEQ